MKILSIDVGIKNLAFCLFDKSQTDDNFKITKWDIVDISEQENTALCGVFEKNTVCNKPAKFKKEDKCFCLKHAKKTNMKIPTTEQKHSFISKQKIKKLHELALMYNIKYDTKTKKNELVNLIKEYISNNYCQSIESKRASDVNLFNIGLNIKTKFNHLFENEEQIDTVIIENQIGPLAIRMKTIQGMIVQYFIMSNLNVKNIEFISAANKLKDFHLKENSKYSDRKKLGISKCLEIITTNVTFNEHIDYFNKHKKKDDLADSFLQGLWFINNK